MLSSSVLDTAIGLSLTFFLVALFCSAAVEALANVFKKRAKYLLRGLRDMLDERAGVAEADESLWLRARRIRSSTRAEQDLYQEALAAGPVDAEPVDRPVPLLPGTVPTPMAAPQGNRPSWTTWLMGHPLVEPLKQSRATGGRTRNPSYLPSSAFASALLDFIVPDVNGATSMDRITASIVQLPESVPFRGALLSLAKTAAGDIDKFRATVEKWYDDQMDRIGGAYKRWSKRWIIILALATAVFLHVDAISISRALYTDGPLREAVAASATSGTLCEPGKPFQETRSCITTQLEELDSEGLPVGWPIDEEPDDVGSWLTLVLGLAITAGAASFGAPFWFDALNRLGSLRNAGKKPATSQ